MEITVYTDGACSNNGQKGAKAGLGVYFGEGDPRNCSQRIQGKQTNNTAELKALIKAAYVLKREILAGFTVNIYSDSSYAMRCCTTYGEKLEKINWTRKKRIPNLELVKEAYYTFKGRDNVKFHPIAAHTGKVDVHSLGNEGADRLANLAIGHMSCPYVNRTKRMGWASSSSSGTKKIYLNLPYDEKEDGKKLGTKWDRGKKKWYILSTMDENRKKTILNLWG